MKIDTAIDRLEDLHFEQDDWEYGELTEDCLLNREALRLAIETMRKYQKIEQIIKTAGIFAFDVPEIKRIAKVLKNGNNNQNN